VSRSLTWISHAVRAPTSGRKGNVLHVELPKSIIYDGLSANVRAGLYWREAMKHLVILHILWISLSACPLVGCGGSRDISAGFQAEDPAARIAAIRRAGQDKLVSALPYLVDRLTDSEAEVRMFAIIALKEITGLTHDFRHYDPAALRQEAVERWRKWLAGNRDESRETRPVEERKTG